MAIASGLLQRPLTLILLQKYRDTNGSRIVIQIGGVYIQRSAKRRAYFCKSIAIEMGGVSRYFSKVLGSGLDVTLLTAVPVASNQNSTTLSPLGPLLVITCLLPRVPLVYREADLSLPFLPHKGCHVGLERSNSVNDQTIDGPLLPDSEE